MSKVTLRSKEIGQSRKSLFLDIYPPVRNPDTGKLQRKHYLKIFIYSKPRETFEREHNKETLELAINEAAKRQLDVQNNRFGFLSQRMLRGNFVEYFEQQMAKRRNDSSLENWKNAIVYFKDFAGDVVKFTELSEPLCEEYASYLLSGPALGNKKIKIKTNTAVAYYAKFLASLKQAFKDGYLPLNLYELAESITPEDSHREFLFLDELQRLADTPCSSELIRRASLFAAVTGLRYSDVSTITWEEIRGSKGNYFIQFSMEKTNVSQFHPIPDQAYELLGVQDTGIIFKGLIYHQVAKVIPKWVKAAGIDKKFSFHCFRHTFATLQLLSGTDIATVSKLLGHKFLQTTMIYVKIVDSLKREASHRIQIQVAKDWQKLAAAS